MDDRRSLWHIVAVIATLALAAVVAVVAVTRDEPGEPAAAGSPSPSPSPTPAASPTGLPGDGPYVVYVRGFDVVAFDVSSGDESRLGALRDDPLRTRSWQPGTGRVVAFATVGGDVWSVTRRGAERIGAIPSDAGTSFDGGAVSPDDRKFAVAALQPEPRIVVLDLQSGRPTTFERTTGREEPRYPLVPVAWSLGGSLVYAIPWCDCDTPTPGLYAVDTGNATSTQISGTGSTAFLSGRVAVSPSGQAVYYGAGRERRCRNDESPPCEDPPFTLRRLAAGQRGSSVLVRASEEAFWVDAISPDGRLLAVRRIVPGRSERLEMYDAEGDRRPLPSGVSQQGVRVVAMLSRDTIVLLRFDGQRGAVVAVHRGEPRTVYEFSTGPGESPSYLGWLL